MSIRFCNKNRQRSLSDKESINSKEFKPNIVVKPANEILTTEEGKKLLQDSLNQMEVYCQQKRQEADEYYEEQKKKADVLEERKEEEIAREVERAVKTKEKEMKELIENAKKEAKQIA